MLYINKNTKVHFVGIGGIGMSGIAEILHELGHKVSGSDVKASPNTQKLKDMGVEIAIGHETKNVKDATVLVYSSAIDHQNPEIIEANRKGIPLIRRAEMLAELMRLKYGIAVAGTHGKTTTTSFLATILHECGLDATHIIGGIVENLGGHAKVGKGDYLVAEADESDGSFLLLSPIMSIITNIDDDHLDHYGNMENLKKAFLEFANKIPFYGLCALNFHDESLRALSKEIRRPYTTFSIKDDEPKLVATYQAENVVYSAQGATFNLLHMGEKVASLSIQLPGRHNVLNSLGAVAIAHHLGLSFSQIAKAIAVFKTVGRRFEKLYEDEKVLVIDDYAHHPTAVLKTLQMLRKITNKDEKVVAIFEPHRYSRTEKCWKEFMHCFNDADEVHFLPIYAASEKPIGGINTKRLVEDINSLHPNLVHYMEKFTDIDEVLKKHKDHKITLITLGAGAIGKNVREWVKGKKK